MSGNGLQRCPGLPPSLYFYYEMFLQQRCGGKGGFDENELNHAEKYNLTPCCSAVFRILLGHLARDTE
jgi:hypothetical protein